MGNTLITGASGGIGAAIAEAFAKEGYNVVLNYNKNEQRAQNLAEKLSRNYGVKCFSYGCAKKRLLAPEPA